MLRSLLSVFIAAGVLIPISANAAPNLIEVQGRVRDLQEQATTAAEGAQEAKVTLAKLNKTLVTVQQEASQQGASVTAMNKLIGAIAADQYKSDIQMNVHRLNNNVNTFNNNIWVLGKMLTDWQHAKQRVDTKKKELEKKQKEE